MHLDIKKIMTPSISMDVKTDFGRVTFKRESHVEDQEVIFCSTGILYKKSLVKDKVNCPHHSYNKTYYKLDIPLEVGIQVGLVYFSSPYLIDREKNTAKLVLSFFDPFEHGKVRDKMFFKEDMNEKFNYFIEGCVNGDYYQTYVDGLTFLKEIETMEDAVSYHPHPDGGEVESHFNFVTKGKIHFNFTGAGKIIRRMDKYPSGEIKWSHFIFDAFGLMKHSTKTSADIDENIVEEDIWV